MENGKVVLVLGPTAVTIGGRLVDLGGPRQRRLLAALAIDAGRPVPWERIADRVWGDDGLPNDPRRTIRTYIRRLRQALGSDAAVVTESGGFRLDDGLVAIDSQRFTELVDKAEQPELDPHRRLALLDQALALWRGPAYEEVAPDLWALPEADRLNELHITAIERRYDTMLVAGMHTDALPGLVRAAEEHPLRDRLVGLRMLALFRTGRQAEAARVFQEHRRRLDDETGLSPGDELIELDRRIVAGDTSLTSGPEAGRRLRGYRLGEHLGEGAFAVVYRGTQPSLGRDVAVKIIRPELANRPEFVRRFETEAHLVARLEHPHIVPLYDYWREPDRACLVFRHLRGGTLEAMLTASGGLAVDQMTTMVAQLGSALATAHRAGVVHRDVKPANVFLDETGNFYLGDFGIALEAAELSDPAAALSAGSPAYASPEQLRHEPIGPTADVYGLGITMFEALTGRLPFPDAMTQTELLRRQLHEDIPSVRERRPHLPVGVDQVLTKATAKNPDARHQSVDQLVADFRAAVETEVEPGHQRVGVTTAVSLTESRNPYKGLRAFTEADVADFYGRERLVERLIETLDRTGTPGRIAAVVGPSGIGKSSLVRAGLLPALRSGAVAGSDKWFIATMLPGADPFEELAAALLRVAVRAPDNLMSQLTDDERGIARIVKAIAPPDGDVLVVIDQFEELFTLADPAGAPRFLASLEHALTDARCPLRLVFTMRADFWDRPLRHGSFARLIEHSTIQVGSLAPDELERAITEPAHRAGSEFEPGLVSEIVAGLTDQPGALPLLQYALTELWDQRTSGLFTRKAYEEFGGLAGAIANRAEDIYAGVDAEQKTAIRQIMGRLVTPGESTEDTRRRALRSEVASSPAATEVIGQFGSARLLSFDKDPTTREPTVEIAHEALIRQWPRLRSWLDEDRDDLRVLRHLNRAAREWHGAGRPHSELYRGGRLEGALEVRSRHVDGLDELEAEFLDAASARLEEENAAERRDSQRLRRRLTAVAVLAVAALVAGTIAVVQQRSATEQRDLAEAAAVDAIAAGELAGAERDAAQAARHEGEIRRLVAESANQLESDRRLGLLMAVEAHQRDPSAETLGAIQRALIRSPQNWMGALGTSQQYQAIDFIDEQHLIALTATDLEVWEIGERRMTTSVALTDQSSVDASAEDTSDGAAPLGRPVALVVGTDRSRLAIGYDDGRWEVRGTDGFDLVDSRRIDDAIQVIALDAGGTSIAVAASSVVQVFPVGRAGTPVTIEQPIPVQGLAYGGQPTMLAVSTGTLNGAATVFDPATGEQVGPELSTGPEGLPGAEVIAWLDEGLLIANQQEVVLLDPPTGEVLHDFDSLNRFSGLGRTATSDDAVLIVGSAGVVERIEAPQDGITVVAQDFQVGRFEDLAVDPSGRAIALLGANGISLLSTDGTGTLAVGVLPTDAPQVKINERGDVALSSEPSRGPIQRWDPSNPGKPPTEIDYAQIGGDRNIFLHGRPDSTEGFEYQIWTDGRATPLDFPGAGFHVIGVSPDLKSLAIGQFGEPVAVVDVADGNVIASLDEVMPEYQTLDPVRRYATDLQFTPDGSELVVAARSGAVFVYDTTSWELVHSPESGFHGIDFTIDGQRALTLHYDRGLELRSADTLEVIDGPSPTSNPIGVGGQIPDLFLDDRYAVVGGLPGGATLWDVERLTPVGDNFPHVTDFREPSLSSDAAVLLTSTGSEAVLWDVNVDGWPALACRAVGRNMTRAEWEQFGPDDTYQATCSQWPTGQ